jgi:hypothetical protein
MKVNLLIGGYPLNGYLNIDALSQQDQTSNKLNHNLENLDDIIDNNECTEFLANGVIDTFPISVRSKVVSHWLSKIEHNGIFVLSGLDLNKAARFIMSSEVDINSINTVLYGPCNNMWTINKGAWSVNEAVNSILSAGQFKILSKSFRGLHYVVKAQRI